MATATPLDVDRKPIIIGGGPAGLTAAYQLTKHNLKPIILEKLDKVGGISRTENYKGYYFDMGGHRFFTKSEEVSNIWHEVLGEDFMCRPRLSRIYYNRTFFNYPLKPLNALSRFGFWQSMLVALNYLRWQLFPYKQEDTFEQWVTNRFGKRLFSMFFKSYTEKVWGVSTSDLTAEFAAQRIKGLDLKAAILTMFIKPKNTIKTLIEEFEYPRQGPGMLWNAVKDRVEESGGIVYLNTTVCGVKRSGSRIEGVKVSSNGREEIIHGTDFISSMPIAEFIFKLDPPPPSNVLEAARALNYRDFMTVCLIVDQPELFKDNWIYIHDPDVKVGRIQNFKNWSPYMVPDESRTSLGMEYFCNEGDELWSMPDDKLVELARRELAQIGLANYADVLDGCVFRVEKAYPVYNSDYAQHLKVIREYVDSLENFQTVGRNGLHRYNNQDHAMLTGILAVRNMLFGEKNDLWQVNAEQEYHEEIQESKKKARVVEQIFARAFPRLDPLAFGISMGVVVGFLLFMVTYLVASSTNIEIRRLIALLNQYFPGYDLTMAGSGLGFLYGFLVAFLGGCIFAWLRNSTVKVYVTILQRRVESQMLEDYSNLTDKQSARSFKQKK